MIRKNAATRGSAPSSRRSNQPGTASRAPGSASRPARSRTAGGRSVLGSYYGEIGRYQILEREEEQALARKAQAGCAASLDRLVESNLRFVVKLANEYRHCGLPVEDLVSEGNIGLIEAAQRFDPDRGTRFISWAAWWIRKSIHAALSDQAQVVRLPTSQLKRMRVVQSTERDLKEKLGREPTREELAAKLPKNLAGVDPIHRHGLRLSSLDDPVCEDRGADSLVRTLADTRNPSAESRMLDREATASVGSYCERLDARQRKVLNERFGLDGSAPLTLAEIGDDIGLSREGVRQIESGAIRRLRKLMAAGDRARPLRETPFASASSDNGRPTGTPRPTMARRIDNVA